MKATETIDTATPRALDLWSALVRVRGIVGGRLAQRLDAELGMLPEEADLLMCLEAAPEQRLRMADASSALALSKSGVTRLVDRLSERGLVERAACPRDRRVVYCGLTEAGRDAVALAAPLLAAGADEYLSAHLTDREAAALLEGLRTILDAEGAGA
jgi:DNA-binding MarR family transcriptional regulator